MAKKTDSNNLYKRDKRRKFDGDVNIDMNITAIFEASDEYLQSVYAAYMADADIFNLKPVRDSRDTPWNEKVQLWTPRYYNKLDRHYNLTQSAYYCLLDHSSMLYALENMNLPKDITKTLYRLSEEEFKWIETRYNGTETIRILLNITMREKYGDDNYLKFEYQGKIVNDTLPFNEDELTEFISHGKIKDANYLQRIVPANEELGTPAFIMSRINF